MTDINFLYYYLQQLKKLKPLGFEVNTTFYDNNTLEMNFICGGYSRLFGVSYENSWDFEEVRWAFAKAVRDRLEYINAKSDLSVKDWVDELRNYHEREPQNFVIDGISAEINVSKLFRYADKVRTSISVIQGKGFKIDGIYYSLIRFGHEYELNYKTGRLTKNNNVICNASYEDSLHRLEPTLF